MEGNEDLTLNPGGAGDPAAGGGDAGGAGAGADDQKPPVPFEEHNTTVAELNRKLEELRDQNQLLRLQGHLGRGEGDGGAGKAKPGDGSFFGDRDDEDVPTVGELRGFEAHLRQQFGGALGEMQLTGQKGDYQEVLKSHLPNFLAANPHYVAILRATPPQLRPRLAYDLGVQDPAYQTKKNKERLEQDPNLDAAAIARNKSKPNLGGKGGSSPLSQAGQFEEMSDQDLEKHIAKVKMGAAR